MSPGSTTREDFPIRIGASARWVPELCEIIEQKRNIAERSTNFREIRPCSSLAWMLLSGACTAFRAAKRVPVRRVHLSSEGTALSFGTLRSPEHATSGSSHSRVKARTPIMVALSGVALGLLALVIWFSRSSEAATVATVVYATQPSAELVPNPKTEPRLEPTIETLPSKLTRVGNVILWHPAAVETDGSYDVVIHFHGVQTALEPAMLEANLRVVLIIINDGLMADAYRDGHGSPGTLVRILDALHAHVAEAFHRDDVHARRVAVSAWSAGFGAVSPMLRRPEDVKRIDAVLVSDGLHASFVEPRNRAISDAQLAPVVNFARRAMARDKLFGITHTEIQTPDYASTTETAHKLLELLSMTPDMILDAESGRDPVPTSVVQKGDFSVLGYAGNDKHAHAIQQWALGRTLWGRLAARWNP